MSRLQKPEAFAIMKEHLKGQEFKRKYDAISIAQIAEKFDVCMRTIYDIEKGEGDDANRMKLSLHDVELILELLQEMRKYQREWQKRTVPALAKKFGKTKSTVRRLVSGESYGRWFSPQQEIKSERKTQI